MLGRGCLRRTLERLEGKTEEGGVMDDYDGGFFVCVMFLLVFFGSGWWVKAGSVEKECREYKVVTVANIQIPCVLKDRDAKGE